MMVRLHFLIVLVLFVDVGSFFSWPSSKSKQDCKWSQWQGAKCIKMGRRSFRIRQTRRKFEAKHGGKKCTGSSVRYINCNEVQYTAQGFFDAVATASPSGSGSSSSSSGLGSFKFTSFRQKTQLSVLNPCATPFYSSSGALRMGGKCVRVTRRRRNAEGFIETYQEPAPSILSRTKRHSHEILSTANRDILFLIDESSSVGKSNFGIAKRFAKTMTSKFCGNIDVGKKKTRVGIMTFDHRQTVHLNFDKYFDKPNIVRTMDKIKYKGGATCIIKTLDFVRKDMITPARGARVYEPGTERLVVFLTDGCNECGDDSKLLQQMKDMQKKLEKQKIAFLSYFVGEGNKCTEKIRALSDGSRCHQYFMAKNWKEVSDMADYIQSQECLDAWRIGKPCT